MFKTIILVFEQGPSLLKPLDLGNKFYYNFQMNKIRKKTLSGGYRRMKDNEIGGIFHLEGFSKFTFSSYVMPYILLRRH